MKFYSIHVREEERQEPSGRKSWSEAKLVLHRELERSQGVSIMHEYTREENRLLRIGVKIEGASNVIVTDTWGGELKLKPSVHEPDVWYDARQEWVENGLPVGKEAIFGSNACGQWLVTAYGADRNVIGSAKVRVIPGLLTAEQYELMRTEVMQIVEDLAYRPGRGNDRDVIRELQVPLFPLERLRQLIDEWAQWLEKIESEPAEKLHVSREKTGAHLIKRWDSKSLLEYAMYPERRKISVRVSAREPLLPEHGMVKWMLEKIGRRVEQERAVENSALEQLKQLDSDLTVLNISSEENSRVLETLQKRGQQIRADVELLERRIREWAGVEKVIQHYSSSTLFDVEEIEPEWTHLFQTHAPYRAVLEVYEQILELTPFFSPREKAFEQALINSPHLFEVWMLLQLVRGLRRLRFDCPNLFESLVNHFDTDGTLSGWSGRFGHGTETIELYYEPRLVLRDGSSVRPDFLLEFRDAESGECHAHTLDAKYKPYVDLGTATLEDDIGRSARRYLNIAKEGTRVRSAALVHIDPRISNWNLDGANRYELSHFPVRPGYTEGIRTYMRRAFHYFDNRINKCASCGKCAAKIDQGYKTTYICDDCSEVWVDNVCSHRNSPFVGRPRTRLLKYASGNYNVQVGKSWNVYCPFCHQEVRGASIRTDIFGYTYPIA